MPHMEIAAAPSLTLRIQQAVDAAELGLWDLRVEHETVHYPSAWKAKLGFPDPHGADSTHFWRCRVHPSDLEGMLAAMRAHMHGSEPSYSSTFRLRSNGSGYRHMRSRGRVIERSSDGRATRMVGTIIDLTPRPCTPGGGLAHGPCGSMAALAAALPFHALVREHEPGDGGDTAASERRRVLGLVDDLLRATLVELEALRTSRA
jgi:hypothetical protein